MGDKEDKTDSKDGSYSDSLEIFDDIFSGGKAPDVPDTKKGPTAAGTTVKKPQQRPVPQNAPPVKKAPAPAAPPEKAAAPKQVQKSQQGPAPAKAPPPKKPAPPAQPIKAVPQNVQAKPKEKQPDAKPEDESYSESQELFDTIFSESADAAANEAKKGPPRPPAQPVKADVPKQFQKAEQRPASPVKPASTEPVKKVEQRVVPPKVTPAKEAVPPAQIVKSGRSFEAETYLDKSPDKDKRSGKKELEKMEIYEKATKSLNPFIIVSSIIVLVILAMLGGMVIEDRSGIIGGIKKTRDSMPEKKAPASPDKDAKTSVAVDKKSQIKEPKIQASQKLKEEVPHAIDKAPSEVPAQVIDKVVASEEVKTLSYPYSIYLGSYNSDEAVKEAKSDYEKKGLSPYWIKVDLGEKGIWFRLYADYFQTKEEADDFIKTSQISGVETQRTKYVNLIGTYSTAQEVAKQREIIEELGYCPYVINDNKNIFRLYVGAFNEKGLVEKHNIELLKKGIQSKVVER